MNPGDFETFGQWLSNQIESTKLSPEQMASALRYPNSKSIKQICDNQSPIPLKDWPIMAKLLNLRFDEFLIVMEYFHPEWVLEYDEFVSNCLRYLLWRMERDQQRPLSFPDLLLKVTLEEFVEPACTSRLNSMEDRRKVDRRSENAGSEPDRRRGMRRVTDLIHYLKNQIGLVAIFNLFTSGVVLFQGGSFS